MPRRRITRACSVPAALRKLGVGEQGSFLVEAMVSALILVMVGLGVLKSIDRSSHLDGEQRTQAVAGSVGQSEQALIRALPLAAQSILRDKVTHVDVGGVTYTTTSRSEWVNDTSGGASCTTPGATADYMKVSTTVTWPAMGTRKPVTLESLISPSVRAFDATQGSLSVQVSDRSGHGVSGLTLALSGGATLSDVTSSDGCVLWGYLPAGSGYAVGFSRPGYLQPDGSPAVNAPVAVVGGQTANVAYQYDAGGYLQTSFVTRRQRTDGTTTMPTNPRFAHVTKGGVASPFPVVGDLLTSGPLFPFTSTYAVDGDSCLAADSSLAKASPIASGGSAPARVTATVDPGATTTTAAVHLPAMNFRVTTDGTADVGANTVVRVTTPCGTVYRRTTIAGGWIDDPGFPVGSALAICVSDGIHSQQLARDNLNFNADPALFAVDIKAATDPAGTCA
jgi:hypothetical protein